MTAAKIRGACIAASYADGPFDLHSVDAAGTVIPSAQALAAPGK